MTNGAWPEAERMKALQIATADGARSAAEKTGIPEGTVRSWLSRNRKILARVSPSLEMQPSLSWARAREQLLPKIGATATSLIDELQKAISEGRYREAQTLATAFGILVDKAQLLSGSATDRSESVSIQVDATELDREIESLRRELAEYE